MPAKILKVELDTLDVERSGWPVLGDLWADLAEEMHTDLVVRFNELGPQLADRIRDTFDAKGARGGNPPWVITFNPTPLIRTRRLYRSFNYEIVDSGETIALEVKTDVPYAREHDQGVGQIPRPFMFFADEDIDLIEEVLSA